MTAAKLDTYECPKCGRRLQALAGAKAWCNRTLCRNGRYMRVMRLVRA